jgi:hypothetical protein
MWKKVASLSLIFALAWGGGALASETEKFPVEVQAKDARTALRQAEEKALRRALNTLLDYKEQLTYGIGRVARKTNQVTIIGGEK